MLLSALPSRVSARLLALTAILLLALVPAPAGAQDQRQPLVHVPPVSAPVLDPFRRPEHPFGPGNRGLEYDTHPGTEVRASADGRVVFAGRAGWELHVTVLHDDGVRTSYSYLSRIRVIVGQSVRQGDVIGLSSDRLHFGARRGDHYLDPATLFGLVEVRVELLPLDVLPEPAGRTERGRPGWPRTPRI